MSPLPKLAGGRPLPDAAIAPAGVRAAIKAPLPITAPPARPAFFRKLRRVSPELERFHRVVVGFGDVTVDIDLVKRYFGVHVAPLGK